MLSTDGWKVGSPVELRFKKSILVILLSAFYSNFDINLSIDEYGPHMAQ